MANEKSLAFENDEIKYYVKGKIGIMKFKRTAFENIADMEKSGNLVYLIDWVEKDDEIRALIMLNEPRAYGKETYRSFMNSILKFDETLNRYKAIDSYAKVIRARQMNSIRNLITKILSFRKAFIMGMRGNVVTPFFGLSLAADFRYGSENMAYSFQHVQYGLHPSGALPFFLPQYMNKGKAVELLYTGKDIPAKEALELGLLHGILPDDDFENACIEKVRDIAEMDPEVMRLTKRLTFSQKDELDHYFNLESKLIGF